MQSVAVPARSCSQGVREQQKQQKQKKKRKQTKKKKRNKTQKSNIKFFKSIGRAELENMDWICVQR